MGWSGGTFTRVHDWTEDEAGGYDILSTRMDEEDDNFESGVNACLTKDGSNSPSNDLPMGGHRHTGVATALAYDQYATAGQVQNSSLVWPITGITGGSLNAYTLTILMAPSAYVAGQMFSFKANRTNSGATTLNVNSLGAKNVYYNGAACAGGELVINRVYTVIYDGTRFHLMGGGGGTGASYGGAKIHLSSDHPIYNRTAVTVPFRTEEYDDSSYYTASTDYLKIPVTGRYRLTAGIKLEFSSVHDHRGAFLLAKFRLNGAVTLESPAAGFYAPGYSAISDWLLPSGSVCWEGLLTANDQVTLYLKQWNLNGSDFYISGEGTYPTDATWMAIERIL